MIGRWLKEVATPEARAALLTERLVAFDTGTLPGWSQDNGAGCLLGVPLRVTGKWLCSESRSGEKVFERFNALCMKLQGLSRPEYVAMMYGRYPASTLEANAYAPENLCLEGAAKAGILIRARILADDARRILQNAPVSRDTEVDAQSVGECRFGRGE